MKKSYNQLIATALLFVCSTGMSVADAINDEALKNVQKQWAKCQYDTFNKDNKISCLNTLIGHNEAALRVTPSRNDLKVWLAINKSTLAGVKGGLGALSLVEEAKALLEEVIAVEPNVLDGSAYTSLGTLYYQVPGWPIGFGDDDEARDLLQKALAINPTGIDPNFFYADFLVEQGKKSEAMAYLQRAQKATPRAGRELADAGRQREIARKLEEIQ